MEYSIQIQKDIRKLYIEGLSFQEISYSIRIPVCNLSYHTDYDKFTDEELSRAVKEFEATHKEYDTILNLNCDEEKFLNKKAQRLIRLLKYHKMWPIGKFQDIAREAKEIFPFFRENSKKYARESKVSYFVERES